LNKFRDFIRKRGLWLGIAVAVVALAYGFAARRSSGGAGIVENAAASLTLPVRQGASGLIGWLENIYGYMFRYDSLVAENAQLETQLAEAQRKLREAEEAERENARFRELLSLSDRHTDFVFEDAKIVDRPSSNWSVSYTIDKGGESGIAVGDCVIDSKYNFVGQIIETGDGWATIRSVIDTDMRIGALVGEGGNAAMVVGDFALMREGETKLSYLTEETQVFAGDVLISSGKGGAFPRGLEIGTVSTVRTEAGGQLAYATVTPSCALGTLSQVFIIKDFNVVD
jgi:rod shape-determining protein MreC